MITLFSSLSLWKIFTISLEMNLRQKKERKKFVVECKLTPLCTFLIFFSCYVLCLMSSKRENEPLLAGRLIWGFDVYFFFLHQIHASSYTQRIESIQCSKDCNEKKIKILFTKHHVLMKGGKFMGAYFYSIILFAFFLSLLNSCCMYK